MPEARPEEALRPGAASDVGHVQRAAVPRPLVEAEHDVAVNGQAPGRGIGDAGALVILKEGILDRVIEVGHVYRLASSRSIARR